MLEIVCCLITGVIDLSILQIKIVPSHPNLRFIHKHTIKRIIAYKRCALLCKASGNNPFPLAAKASVHILLYYSRIVALNLYLDGHFVCPIGCLDIRCCPDYLSLGLRVLLRCTWIRIVVRRLIIRFCCCPIVSRQILNLRRRNYASRNKKNCRYQ